jgi:hypothetical protein
MEIYAAVHFIHFYFTRKWENITKFTTSCGHIERVRKNDPNLRKGILGKSVMLILFYFKAIKHALNKYFISSKYNQKTFKNR